MPSDNEALDQLGRELSQAELVISLQIANGVNKTAMDLETLITTMRASGASDDAILEVLENDLKNSGRIFGAFKNHFKTTAEFGVGRMATYGSKYELERRGVQQFKWQAVGKNICPDCLDRHGRLASWEEWEFAGLPQSGFSVCGLHCNCDLVPTDQWVENPMRVPIETE